MEKKIQLRPKLASQFCYFYKIITGMPMKIFLSYNGCNTGFSHYPLPLGEIHNFVYSVNSTHMGQGRFTQSVCLFLLPFSLARTQQLRGNRQCRAPTLALNVFSSIVAGSLNFPDQSKPAGVTAVIKSVTVRR